MEVTLKERFEKKEFGSNEKLKKVIIIGSTVAAFYSSAESIIKSNEEINNISVNEEFRNKDISKGQSFKRLHFNEQSNTELIYINKSYPVLLRDERNEMKVNIMSNIPVNYVLINSKNSNKSAIINSINDGKREDSDMQQLISHRETVEKTGIILGVALGSIVLIPSILSFLNWGATIPAAIMFFSLSGFMIIRKKLRGLNNEN